MIRPLPLLGSAVLIAVCSPHTVPGADSAPAAEAAPGPGIAWAASVESALETARKERKPLMLDFWADWCGFCKKLDRETFTNDLVIRLVTERFVAVKVDTTKDGETARKHSVSGLPTIVFLSPEGEELRRIVGFRPPDGFLEEARRAADSSGTLSKLREEAEKAPESADAQRAYARALFAAGNFDGAAEVLDRALRAAPPDSAARPGLLLDLGDALRLAGKPERAKETYREILAMDPSKAGDERKKALLPLGRSLVAVKELDSALPILTEALASPSVAGEERLEALFLRGFVHAVKKDADRAIADLKAAKEADPDGRWGLRAGAILDVVEIR